MSTRGRRVLTGMAVIVVALVASMPFVPVVRRQALRSKESALQQNLRVLRQTIDEYTFDQKKPPQDLQDLVKNGYLRAIPDDPISGTNQWRVVHGDRQMSADRTAPGVFDVRSYSDRKSLAGIPYSEW